MLKRLDIVEGRGAKIRNLVFESVKIFQKFSQKSPDTLFSSSHKAFTLAETLITLTIIGVIAAMTTPSLVTNYQKDKTAVQLRKIYSTLNQALRISESKYGPYEDWDSGVSSEDLLQTNVMEYYETYWFPSFKVAKICTTYSECGYSSNYPWKRSDGGPSDMTFTAHNYRVPFILADGTLISISLVGGSVGAGTLAQNAYIFIDLNGSRAPNKIGRDMFIFDRTSKKGIMPQYYNWSKTDLDKNCKASGYGCTAKIMKAGWKIEDDYPW